MKSKLLLFLFIVGIKEARTQNMPIEIMGGNHAYYHQFSISKLLNRENFGLSNVSSVILQYFDKEKSELMSQSYFNYIFSDHLKIGIGLFYASKPGLKPSFNFQFIRKMKYLFIMISPRLDLIKNPTFDVMTMIEFKPRLLNYFTFYFRFQNMFNYTRNIHNRSYQYFRIGIEKGNKQFGLGINHDFYGEIYRSDKNIGIFYKINLK